MEVTVCMLQNCISSKQKKLEIKSYPLGLGNNSKDFTINNMKTTGLNLYIHDFSVDYDTINVSDIVEIQKSFRKR